MRYIAIAVLFVSAICAGQTPQTVTTQPQAVATVRDLQYVRFIILNIASLDHDPAAIQNFENSLVKLLGLSVQDSSAIHNTAVTMKPLLAQYRQAAQAIVAGKAALAQADIDALHQIDAQREQSLLNLGNQIMSSVSPAVAARLLNAANILAVVKGN